MTPANADCHCLTTRAHIRDALGPRAINGALLITSRPQSKQRHPLNIERQQDRYELFMRAGRAYRFSEAKRFADTMPKSRVNSLLFMGNPNTNKTQ
ncbi:hypothetical protein QQF64_009190 [Cirrhinus molitorella]|uniref:Uncharacterized protein n=1 Tax=Cirrhinus molitorella TaxID=172907 RepID=A0ABR3M0G7_9TELE